MGRGRKPKQFSKEEKQKIIDDYNFYNSVFRVSKVNNINTQIVKKILKENNIEYDTKIGRRNKKEHWKNICYKILKNDGDFKSSSKLLEIMKKYNVTFCEYASSYVIGQILKNDDRFLVKKIKNKNYYGVDE